MTVEELRSEIESMRESICKEGVMPMMKSEASSQVEAEKNVCCSSNKLKEDYVFEYLES